LAPFCALRKGDSDGLFAALYAPALAALAGTQGARFLLRMALATVLPAPLYLRRDADFLAAIVPPVD